MKFRPTLSVGDLSKMALELVRNHLILDPKAPPSVLADRIIEEADQDFLAELNRSLCVQSFTRLIRIERRKASEKRRAKLPPEFSRLPLRIVGKRGKLVWIHEATFEDSDCYCKYLGKKFADQKRQNPKFLQAQAFRDRMREPSQKERGITAGEVMGLDFGG